MTKYHQSYTVELLLAVSDTDPRDGFYVAVRIDSTGKPMKNEIAIGDTPEEAIANYEIMFEADKECH